MTEGQLYRRAAEIVRLGMGYRTVGAGRAAHKVWLADEDPLAHVAGIEAILALVQTPPPVEKEAVNEKP